MDIREAARRTREHVQGRTEDGWPKGGMCGRAHVTWMLERIEAGEIAGEKAHRWLGWAQCSVVAAGAGALDEMKEINCAA